LKSHRKGAETDIQIDRNKLSTAVAVGGNITVARIKSQVLYLRARFEEGSY
jgi:hypothetical protein